MLVRGGTKNQRTGTTFLASRARKPRAASKDCSYGEVVYGGGVQSVDVHREENIKRASSRNPCVKVRSHEDETLEVSGLRRPYPMYQDMILPSLVDSMALCRAQFIRRGP
jgi:hypothetical protein